MPEHPPATPPAAEYEIVFAQLRSAQVTDLLQQSARFSREADEIGRLVEAVRETATPRFVTFTTG